MSPAVANKPNKTGSGDEGKRKPGRPPTGVESDVFSCRASLALIAAFTELAKVTRLKRAGTELLRAAEGHVIRMYREVKSDPDSAFLEAAHIPAFLEAAEAYLKEAGRWPLPDEA